MNKSVLSDSRAETLYDPVIESHLPGGHCSRPFFAWSFA